MKSSRSTEKRRRRAANVRRNPTTGQWLLIGAATGAVYLFWKWGQAIRAQGGLLS